MVAVDQAGNNDEPARIELPVRWLRWLIPGSNKFCDFAAVDNDTVCRIGFGARPDGKGILNPGSQQVDSFYSFKPAMCKKYDRSAIGRDSWPTLSLDDHVRATTDRIEHCRESSAQIDQRIER